MASRRDVAIVEAYVGRYNRLRTTTGVIVGRLWDQYAGLDDGAAERFTEAAASAVLAAQAAAGAQVDGYLAALTGEPVTGFDPEQVSGAAVRNGTDPLEVYLRGIITARAATATHPFREAMNLGRLRVVSAAETDVALTQRAAVSLPPGVVGYRRVLTGSSCPLCQIASTQRYRRGDLMPIHSHCDCGIAPIAGTEDPGQVINRKLLNDLKKNGEVDRISRQRQLPKAREALDNAKQRVTDLRREIEAETDQERETRLERRLGRWQQEVTKRERRVSTLSEAPKRPQVAVHEHGELGPVLTDASHAFDDLAA